MGSIQRRHMMWAPVSSNSNCHNGMVLLASTNALSSGGSLKAFYFSAAVTSAVFVSSHVPTHACSTLPFESISRVVGVAVSL